MINGQQYSFKSITLKTSKLSEQRQFYVDRLGFNCVKNDSDTFIIQCGSTLLQFEEWDQKCLYHFAFNIPENQIRESAEWIKNYTDILCFEGKEIVDFPNWNAHSVYFKDAAGNILEFIARHNLKNRSNSQFDIQLIDEISEIGVPVNSISDLLKKLKGELNFDLFWGNMENFAAIGHEKCLFIAVAPHRAWFPTDNILSQLNPIRIELSNENSLKSIEQIESDYFFLK